LRLRRAANGRCADYAGLRVWYPQVRGPWALVKGCSKLLSWCRIQGTNNCTHYVRSAAPKGASGYRLTASLKRCPDTKPPWLRPQRGQNILPRRMPGGRKTSQQAHNHRKDDRRYSDSPREVQTENRFAEGELVADARAHAVERQHQDNPNRCPQQRKQQRLNHERGENAGPGKSDDPQGCDLLRAIGYGRIHCIHGGKAGTDRHDDGYNHADKFDRSARTGLLLVILGFERALQLQPLIVADAVFQRVGCNRISCPQINRSIASLAVEVRGDLVDVAPDFGIIGSAARIEDADYLPLSFGKVESVADVGAGKTIMNGIPNDHFALSGCKPAAFDQFGAGTQSETGRHQAAHRHVHLAGSILARQHYHHDPFTGG